MEDKVKVITEETENLLKAVGIDATIVVEPQEEAHTITITTEENALLIGRHGDTLSSFEFILSLIVAQKLGEFNRLMIEVGGYRKEREEYLRDLAERLKQEVVEKESEKSIRGLKPWERRLIHMHLSEDDTVMTESSGEDRDRVLVIKKK